MKWWPFEVALRGETSSRHLLRWLMTVVVSEVEKAPVRRQAGIRKASASESLRTCRNGSQVTSKPGQIFGSGMSLAGARLLARWCPAWKRREPDLLLPYGTWEGVPRHCCPVR